MSKFNGKAWLIRAFFTLGVVGCVLSALNVRHLPDAWPHEARAYGIGALFFAGVWAYTEARAKRRGRW